MTQHRTPSLSVEPSRQRTWWILALVSLASVGTYLIVSGLVYRIGFPLDDAWIHQTYARNLALRGEWSFIPGRSSGGSTAPLWSALLALGHLFRMGPYGWTYLLGAAALWGVAITGEKTAAYLVPGYAPRFPWVGAFLALEWHLAWAAVSGMETLLVALLVLLSLYLIISGSTHFFALGLLIGLSVWVRPDGITLLGPAVLGLLLGQSDGRSRMRALFHLALGFGGLFSLYLLFNLAITGSPWPNTFYAKQAEYAVYLQRPLLARLGDELLQPLIGAGIILLAGMVINLMNTLRKKAWGTLAVVLWLLGYLGLYAWRLPVIYQHGRYVIPAMPIFFVLGLAGLIEFSLGAASRSRNLLKGSWAITTALVLLLFWGRGAYAYAQDVAVIESEMVATSHWVAANVPSKALVAAHDIGALGYYGQHDLVDLAGLISPEVIPFLRDEDRIAAYLSERRVQYLVTFPDWYPQLVKDRQPIFTSKGAYAPAYGETNMAVYIWP